MTDSNLWRTTGNGKEPVRHERVVSMLGPQMVPRLGDVANFMNFMNHSLILDIWKTEYLDCKARGSHWIHQNPRQVVLLWFLPSCSLICVRWFLPSCNIMSYCHRNPEYLASAWVQSIAVSMLLMRHQKRHHVFTQFLSSQANRKVERDRERERDRDR